MSSQPEASNSATRPILHIRARSGTITEVIGDIFTSLPSKFRRRLAESSDSSEKLMQMISKITIKDIKGAKRCGGGGCGVVLLLEHPTKGKVALKQLQISGVQGGDDLRRRTLREGDTWQDLSHPCVLPFLGILETPTDLYLISPYVENGSLDEYLRQYPDADRRTFLQETAGAIAYLHECGIVHGDIKASNILVSDDIHALLCDFGLARPETIVTSIGLEGLGTIRFKSPELLNQGRGKTPASDAWAFGMTIYQVLSGNIPFPEYNTARMIDAVANKEERPPKSPSHSPSGLSYRRVWNVAAACWEKNPARRLSMQAAHERLRPGPMVLQGHTGEVNYLAFSPDGTTIVSASDDQTIRLWDLESGSQQGEAWTGHPSVVNGVAFSPDGKTVVSGCSDNTVRIWNAESGSQQGEAFTSHTRSVSRVAFSPDGNTVVSGSYDNTLRLWNADSRNQRNGSLIGHTGPVQCFAFSLDGGTIVSGSHDETIRLWSADSGSQRGEAWKGHLDMVTGVAFSPDGNTVVSGSSDRTVRIWDVESGSQRGEALKGHTEPVRCIALSPDGGTIVSGSRDMTLRLWSTDSGSQQGEVMKGHTGPVWCVAFSPDGRTVASGSADCTIRIWDV